MDETPKEEIGRHQIIVGIIFVVVFVIAVVWITSFFSKTKSEEALESYRAAVTFCGENNIEEHNYTNGSKDFDCKDYSLIK